MFDSFTQVVACTKKRRKTWAVLTKECITGIWITAVTPTLQTVHTEHFQPKIFLRERRQLSSDAQIDRFLKLVKLYQLYAILIIIARLLRHRTEFCLM